MTHDELVERAIKWLLGRGGCSIAFSEFATGALEIPDAIGFNTFGSTVVECKRSRSDFLADKRKVSRKSKRLGMGQLRYYMTVPGVIAIEDLPDKWGLLEVHNRHVRIVVAAYGFSMRDRRGEFKFLVSMLRRCKYRLQRCGSGDRLNQWLKIENMSKSVKI